MSPKPKTKMVSFRLSPDEYHLCRKACSARGARNISELARTALQFMLVEHPVPPDERVRELQERVRMLSADIERYAAELTPQHEPVAEFAQDAGRGGA